jgi:hypothetical protein
MTGTDLCVNWTLIVPVIFEPPCIKTIHFFFKMAVEFQMRKTLIQSVKYRHCSVHIRLNIAMHNVKFILSGV